MSRLRIFASLTVILGFMLLSTFLVVWAFPLKKSSLGIDSQRTIQGNVYDPTGALIPGVKVQIVLGDTRQVFDRAVTDDGGHFELTRPSLETIFLRFVHQGFRPAVYTAEQLNDGPLHVVLEVGQITETVEIRSTTNAQEEKASPKKPQKTPLRIAGDIAPPKILHKVNPVYPPAAKRAGVEGLVTLSITINEQGEVWDAQVTRGDDLLRASAVTAVKKWRFSPTLINGLAVPVMADVEITFSLSEPKKSAPEPPQTTPIRVGGAVQESKLLSKVAPEYPQEAKEKGIQGIVILQLTINEKGEVSDVKVLKGDELLSKAAVDAVRQWQYVPTLLNGEPVSVIATVTLNFTLDSENKGRPRNPQP